jgi:hypothetical protein
MKFNLVIKILFHILLLSLVMYNNHHIHNIHCTFIICFNAKHKRFYKSRVNMKFPTHDSAKV